MSHQFLEIFPIWRLALLTAGGAIGLMTMPVQASPITPDTNGATLVERSGDVFNIDGGITSADDQALFHAFTEFGLTQDQVASFVTQPAIQSILGSVTGGNASYIDGLLQVTGSSADLYLVNPAGVLLGPNARLDLSGSFAAATASSVLFEDDWFNVLSPDDFGQMAGAPTGFAFSAGSTGAVVNGADLSVAAGESITLVGGQVISTGTLTAPGGDIIIAAVPDQRWVRISQTESLLSLELATVADAAGEPLPFAPLTLPELLTGGDATPATGITVNSDGTIALVDTTVADQAGTAIATGTLATAGAMGGTVTMVGDRVSLLAATVNAAGDSGGGTIRIGGDLEGQATLPGSSLTYVDAASAIAADALQTGDGGTVILWSDDTTGFFGEISAQGGAAGGDGGFVEVSAAQTLIFDGTVDTAAPLGSDGELLIDPIDIVIRNGTADGDDTDLLATLLSNPDVAPTDPIPTEIYESELEALSGDTAITLRASNNITLEDLADNELSFAERPPILVNGVPIADSLPPDQVPPDPAPIRFEAGGAFTMAASDTLSAPGRDLFIQAGDTVTLGNIRTWRDGNDNDNIAPAVETDGSLTVIGSSIQGGFLNTLQRQIIDDEGRLLISGAVGLGGGNASRVYLESTEGDITVDGILAGAGGLVVNAARTFRAEDFFRVEAVSERDADGNAIASDIYDLSVFVAIPLPRDENDSPIPPPADQPFFFRGTRLNPATRGEIAIAFDIQNARRFEDLEFFVGPALPGDGGVAPPAGENGTFAGLLFAEPDRTIVLALENVAFGPVSEVADTTNLDDLSDEPDTSDETETDAARTASEASTESGLTVCDENAEEQDEACEE